MWGLRSLQLCCKMCWPLDRLLVIWHPFDKSKINLWNESGFQVIWDHSPPIVKAVSRRFRCLTFKVNPRFCSRKYDAHDAPSFQSQVFSSISTHEIALSTHHWSWSLRFEYDLVPTNPWKQAGSTVDPTRWWCAPPPVFTGLCGGAAGVCRKEDKEDQRPELTTSQSQTKVQPPKGHSYLVVGASQIIRLT